MDELEKRNLVAQVTSRAVRQHLIDGPRTIYLGIDPTARSMHVGNLLALVALLHFALKGHQTIVVLGGATGMVGDPSGRTSERVALSQDILKSNMGTLHQQLTKLVTWALRYAIDRLHPLHGGPSDPPLVKNNLEWTEGVTLLDFLSTIGKTARVSSMLARDSVKQRLQSGTGLSFTEFTYQLLQAYDFSQLSSRYGCSVQVGGSDQYGNIMSGIELMSRFRGHSSHAGDDTNLTSANPAYGITFPLLTTAKGEKLGKSTGNALWLDPTMTAPVDLYQTFLRVPDAEVVQYLKKLTFVPLEEIDHTFAECGSRDQRKAQKLLAKEITLLVHGRMSA